MNRDIAAAYGRLAQAGVAPDSAAADEVVRRHVEWLRGPVADVSRAYLRGLGELYVTDPRFGANYPGCAEFVRDALRAYAGSQL